MYSEDEADLYFGAGSLAAAMARAAINANSYLQLDVIGIADGGAGKAATGAVKVTGTATSSGTLSVWIAGEQIAINVDVGDETVENHSGTGDGNDADAIASGHGGIQI
ncbi:tail sheath protein [Escherichia coli]|nr:hypothetical protein [Escherichia coli]STJ90100.1 tail sheath protein [Escherichia coli]